MNGNEKNLITERLREYCDRIGSQNKAATALKISAATVSQILGGNHELVSEEMWRAIASQIGYSSVEWHAVETRDFKKISSLLADAQQNSNVFAITGEAGIGKSFTARRYQENNRRVYMLLCAEYWNRKVFLSELLAAMGRDHSGYNVNEMMYEVVRGLKSQDKPLIILDEADKLSDQVLYFFITLYNATEEHAGIVLLSTDHLAKRIRRGIKLNRKGYKEIYSRIARRFIELSGPGSHDISAICIANGINRKESVRAVIDDSEGDLRRVRRKVHAMKNH